MPLSMRFLISAFMVVGLREKIKRLLRVVSELEDVQEGHEETRKEYYPRADVPAEGYQSRSEEGYDITTINY
ncbi:hypothetical protein JCM16138_14910 [Thermococcus atlanticus]